MGGFGNAELPVMQRGWWNIGFELAGAAMFAWAWRFFGLTDPARRRQFVEMGELTRAL